MRKKNKIQLLVEQIARFGIVGVIATILDYVLLLFLVEVFNVHYFLAGCISFSVSVVFNYIASLKWVFHVEQSKNKLYTLILFIIFSIVGLCINQLIMWIGVEIYVIHYGLVKIGATAVVMIFNFVTRKMFLE